MKNAIVIGHVFVLSAAFLFVSCSTEEKQAKPAPAPAASAPAAATKAPSATASAKTESKEGSEKAEKAKVQKAKGDVGLIDTEKNYMILVTKEGKLLTLDFDTKTKAMQITPTPAKIADVGLGSSATVTYEKVGEKNHAKDIEFKPAKGGD